MILDRAYWEVMLQCSEGKDDSAWWPGLERRMSWLDDDYASDGKRRRR